jgi:putative hemolysin
MESEFASGSGFPHIPECRPVQPLVEGKYRVKFASTREEYEAALRLRFEVFNLELGEGLADSFESGKDQDRYDPYFHHLIVEDTEADRIVGTYRMQTWEMAASGAGFYSNDEFDLEGLPLDVRQEAVEIGRASVALPYRNRQVLFLLWKGLAQYLSFNRKRYFFGCCSITSQDTAEGLAVHRHIEASGLVHPSLQVSCRPGFECQPVEGAPPFEGQATIPPLFKLYLRYGSRVVSPPVLDREFKTIDWLVLFDFEDLAPHSRKLFFGY